MYSLLVLLLALVACTQVVLSKAVVRSFCDLTSDDRAKGYKSILNENFDSPALDRNVWTVIQSDERLTYSFACGRDALCTNNNVYIEDGDLVLRTKKQERVSPTDDKKTFKHTTGGVHTRDKFTIQPTPEAITRICVRGKIPTGEIVQVDGKDFDTGQGLWPAYWTLASNARNTGKKPAPTDFTDKSPISADFSTPAENLTVPVPIDGYTSCNPDEGEMDIMEHYGSRPNVEATYHYQVDLEKGNCQYPDNHGSVYTTVENVDLKEYHEYAVEIGPDYIGYYFDGALKTTWRVGETASKSGKMMNLNNTSAHYLYLNTAYGGVVGPYDDSMMPEEGFFNRIDHVKVVQYLPHNKETTEDDFAKDWLPGILVISFVLIAAWAAYLFSRKPANEQLANHEALINESY